MSRRRCGFSLVEAVVFMLVLAIGLGGILVLYNQLTIASVDPLVRKQALALAVSLMEEITLRPFTYCDPDDPLVHTADPPTLPCGTPEVIGIEGAETRATFDNVSDYDGFQMGAGTPNPLITTLGGSTVDGVADYRIAATVAESAVAPVGANDSLLVTVTAIHVPSGRAVQLQGYRMRYAPNQP